MSAVIDNYKHYLNNKIATNNLRLTHHILYNRADLTSYTSFFTSTNMIVRRECENSNDNTKKLTERIMNILFYPNRNELSLVFLDVFMDIKCWAWNTLDILVTFVGRALGLLKDVVGFRLHAAKC